MSRLLGLPDALRAFGLEPIEVAGWRTRGVAFDGLPKIHLRHWTAGPRTGLAPSLRICTIGRPDLPGPLCQVLQERSGRPGLDRVYVIASGRANHAGTGTWAGVTSGNRYGTGNEIEWSGPAEPFAGNRKETSVRIAAALQSISADAKGLYCCEHREYARPIGRKIDTNLSGAEFRLRVQQALTPQPKPPVTEPPEQDDDDMAAPTFYIYFKDNRDPVANYNRYMDVSEKPLVEGVHVYACSGGFGVYQGPESMAIADYLNGPTVGLAKIGSATAPQTLLVGGKANGWFMGFHLVDGPLAGIKK